MYFGLIVGLNGSVQSCVSSPGLECSDETDIEVYSCPEGSRTGHDHR